MTQSSSDHGFVEAAQRLLASSANRWTQGQLLEAAQRAALRNTGWPIGLVLQTDDLKPKPSADGIEARFLTASGDLEDYWRFSRDGSFYVTRLFEEDYIEEQWQSSEGHPARALWFDLRIWRIVEIILHSASLYQALGIPPDEPFLLSIAHLGLKGREFYTSTPLRHVRRGRFSQVAEASWRKELTQDLVQASYRDLVEEAATELFVLFDFADIGRPVIDSVLDDFEKRRI